MLFYFFLARPKGEALAGGAYFFIFQYFNIKSIIKLDRAIIHTLPNKK